MENLNHLEHPESKWQFNSRSRTYKSTNEKDLPDKFPSPMYFQTHFAYIHEQNARLYNELIQLKKQYYKLEKKLHAATKNGKITLD